jgi:V/A-type H+-transporting ATPase subunit E
MTEDLQNLIDRIQKEGLSKAESEAGRIVAAAQESAAGLVRDAEARAKDIVTRAESDSRTFVERGNRALEQVARDTILLVRDAVSDTLGAIVRAEVGRAIAPEVLQEMVIKVVAAYADADREGRDLRLVLAPEDAKRIGDYFLQRYRTAIEKGLRIEANKGIPAGFRVSSDGTHVHHDFTPEKIAEAFCQMLRPRLAEIVKQAAK